MTKLNALLDLENGKAENIDLAGQEEMDMVAEEKTYCADTIQRNRR